MSWTEDRVSLLRKLWGDGHTAAEIAKELGEGVTRNAVIGKAHRLKLSGRVSPIQQNKKTAVKAADKVSSSRKVAKTSASSSSPIQAVKPGANDCIKPEKPKNTETGEETGKFDLLDLKPRMCRWPVGDPQESEFGFCGADVIMGLPYCAEHAKRAYQAATRNRILQVESNNHGLSVVDTTPEGRRQAGGKASAH